MTTQGDT